MTASSTTTAVEFGRKLEGDKARETLAGGLLTDGEPAWYAAITASMTTDRVVVTSGRVILLRAGRPESCQSVYSDTIVAVETSMSGAIALRTSNGGTTKVRLTHKDDRERFLQIVEHLRAVGNGAAVREAVFVRETGSGADPIVSGADPIATGAPAPSSGSTPIIHDQKALNRQWLSGVTVRSDAMNTSKPVPDKAITAIKALCRPGEKPWLVVASGSHGVLAAWEDRLAIVKVGALASTTSGSMGAGRTTTFHYAQVSSVEYNGGMLMGVLEIVVSGYNGGETKDYWSRSSSKQNNTLPMSNALYRQIQGDVVALQARVAESKRPTVHVSAPAAPATAGPGLGEQIRELKGLLDDGLITQEEFERGKAVALASLCGV